MSKFVFMHINAEENISIELNGTFTHDHLTRKFVDFLRACGYVFPGADLLGIVVGVRH